jgi:hypothetical protein
MAQQNNRARQEFDSNRLHEIVFSVTIRCVHIATINVETSRCWLFDNKRENSEKLFNDKRRLSVFFSTLACLVGLSTTRSFA